MGDITSFLGGLRNVDMLSRLRRECERLTCCVTG